MTQEFDARKSYLAVKASEKMVAFVGFVIPLEKDGKTKEGVVKISSFHRPYGGGYLTLTFMVDKGRDEAFVDRHQRLCGNLTEDTIRPLMGKGFERMVKVDLDLLERSEGWHIEEINVYFRTVEGREKVLIENQLLPAIEKLLPCKFDPVEWWPEVRKTQTPEEEEIEGHISLRGLFRKWFGTG
jgi:hypothetical protein